MDSQEALFKLSKVQLALKVPKSQYNDFGKFYYRSCEDILDAVKPVASELGCVLTSDTEPVVVGEWHYIKATATLTDLESKEQVTAHGYAREAEVRKGSDVSQVTGAASTYALKYALGNLFCLDDNKDADSNKASAKAPPENQPFVAACKVCGLQYRFSGPEQLETSRCSCGGREFEVV